MKTEQRMKAFNNKRCPLAPKQGSVKSSKPLSGDDEDPDILTQDQWLASHEAASSSSEIVDGNCMSSIPTGWFFPFAFLLFIYLFFLREY